MRPGWLSVCHNIHGSRDCFMTLADIDKALAQWESRLASAAHNLFDLQADPTYQCLTGTGGAPLTKLSGVTQAKVAPALENIGTLFQCFDLLRCTVDRAVQVRRDMPSLFGADQKAREIEQLLTGRSIRIPADQIPMAKRSLLTGADDQGCISPGELLTSMEKCVFVTARDGVMAVRPCVARTGCDPGRCVPENRGPALGAGKSWRRPRSGNWRASSSHSRCDAHRYSATRWELRSTSILRDSACSGPADRGAGAARHVKRTDRDGVDRGAGQFTRASHGLY